MLQRDPFEDMIGLLSIAGLFALFVVCYGVWANRRLRAQSTRFWAPFAAVVDGRPSRYSMSGTYEGRPVTVSLGADPDTTRRYFSLALETAPGRDLRQRIRDRHHPARWDWSVQHTVERLRDIFGGEPVWHITTKDDALKQELARVGLFAELDSYRTYPRISYDASWRKISLVEDLDGALTPELFRSRLALLARLAQLTETSGSPRG